MDTFHSVKPWVQVTAVAENLFLFLMNVYPHFSVVVVFREEKCLAPCLQGYFSSTPQDTAVCEMITIVNGGHIKQ